MPLELGEGALSVAGTVLRFIVIEFFWELAIKLPGVWILKALGRRPDPDGWQVVLTGIAFWIVAASLFGLAFV